MPTQLSPVEIYQEKEFLSRAETVFISLEPKLKVALKDLRLVYLRHPLTTTDKCMYRDCPRSASAVAIIKVGLSLQEAKLCEEHHRIFHGKEVDTFPWRTPNVQLEGARRFH